MSADPTISAPPGWYEDPEAPDVLRWWDGHRWSETGFAPKPLQGWGPPAPDATNRIARWARTVFFWALGVGVCFWLLPMMLTFLPDPRAQTVGVVLVWIGGLPAFVLMVLAIVFGAIGARRAGQLDGIGRGAALTGLFGGIGLLAAPALLALVAPLLALVFVASN